MMKYDEPKLNIQEFDESNTVTMSDNVHNLVQGLEGEGYNAVIQVSYHDIIEYNN